MAARDGLARIQLIGPEAAINEQLAGQDGAEQIDVLDPTTSDKLDGYAAAYLELRKKKGATPEVAREAMSGQLGFAAMMVREGDSDGTIGGAVRPRPTPSVLRCRLSARRPTPTSSPAVS